MWRLGITFLVFFMMVFCLLTKKEIFPFAPYTMYSNRYEPQYQKTLNVFFKKNDGKLLMLENETIRPFDEARMKHAFMTAYYENHNQLQSELVNSRGREILSIAKKNTGEKFKSLHLEIVGFSNLEDLRQGKSVVWDSLVIDAE